MWMSVAHAADKGYVDVLVCPAAGGHTEVCGHCCSQMQCECPWSAPAGDHVDVCHLLYHQRSHGCPWSVPPLETMLRSMVCADARGHVDICCPWCHQKPCGSSWSMFPLTVKGKEASFAMVLMTVDSQLRMRDTEDFCVVGYLYTVWSLGMWASCSLYCLLLSGGDGIFREPWENWDNG